ncbi:NAD-dependent epimerase/dehydratase family protein [Parvularcula maris]|uniref:NAD-dependent epimerase/dehydratase family protein n=1 Tax=Parvularcula maris TaxID=2965077 RepID=A0A9X2LAV7_9PROT|nr:NAD-dependent epimerase/dehydratase family protein [Parvularcula maris]MCQ8186336.1 NAD-dependent epimerase/dehydratase family protein [Parvularcula maris]
MSVGDEDRSVGANGERWAVTGGTGLVGRAVLRCLGGSPATALYRSSPGQASADWMRGDLDDRDALSELCREADRVVHIAGLTAGSDEALHHVNVRGAENVAIAAREAGAGHFVLISSQAAREPQLSPYALSKRLGEEAVLRAAGPDMAVTIVRPPAVLGHDDEAMRPILASLGAGLLPVPSLRRWKEKRLSLVTADDLARFVVSLPKQRSSHPVEPATIASTSWSDLAEATARLSGRTVRTVPVPSPILYVVGAAAELARAAGIGAGVMSRGKVSEMLHRDWSARSPGEGRTQDLASVLAPFLCQSNVSELAEMTLRSERPHA